MDTKDTGGTIGSVTTIGRAPSVDAKAAMAEAKQQVADESQRKAIALLKGAYQRKAAAETVVANVDREIADLELRITQGNF